MLLKRRTMNYPTTVSLKLDRELYDEIIFHAGVIMMSKSKYIRNAITEYNKIQEDRPETPEEKARADKLMELLKKRRLKRETMPEPQK